MLQSRRFRLPRRASAYLQVLKMWLFLMNDAACALVVWIGHEVLG
jgi:hypothetical protein